MTHFVDLSHTFEDGMPGFRLQNEDGSYTEYTAHIHPFLTHEETTPKYDGKCSFEITEMTFQTSVGTYLDSPSHRYPGERDVSELAIEELVLPGIVIDAQDADDPRSIGTEVIPEDIELTGKAVLFNFGWDRYWGTEQYYSYPYISTDLIDYLLDEDAALIGVDTLNIDDATDLSRPAHSKFLEQDTFIVENLCNLDRIPDRPFRIFAVPIKASETAAMPIRAFAEVE
jgi:arylformamidase